MLPLGAAPPVGGGGTPPVSRNPALGRMLVLRTLGSLSLATSAGEELAAEAKPLLVLAVLALLPGYEAERGYLAKLLWPSSGRSRALSSLRQALHQLKALGADPVLHVDETRCRLQTDLLEVDVWAFHRAVEDGRLRDAVSVYGGPFLSTMRDKMGSELAHWADAEETRVQIALGRAFAAAIRAAISRGATSEAEGMARRFANENPLSEQPRLLLIEALTAQGRDLEALQEAESYRTLLSKELSDEPGPAFAETVERLTEAVRAGPGREPAFGPPASPAHATQAPLGDDPGTREAKEGRAGAHGFGGRAGAALALLAAGVVAVAAWAGWPDGGRDSGGPRLELRVPARVPDGAAGELIVTADAVSFTPWAHQEPDLHPSPSGDRYAFIERTPRGIDLIVGERGGARRPLLTSEADEHPLDWSPDGERLLYRKGHYDGAANEYRVALGTWEARTDARREFPLPGFDGKAHAAWSPDGTAIAVGGGGSLLVMTPAGDVITRAGGDGGFVGPVAWSPDGRRIATTIQSSGPGDVYVMSRDDATLRRVVATAGHETGAVWLGDQHLLAISHQGTRARLLLIDVAEERARILADDVEATPLPALEVRRPAGASASGIREAFFGPSPPGVDRMVDSIVLVGPETPVSVGEHLLFRTVPLDAGGETLLHPTLGLRWSVEGGNAGKVDDGVFVVESEGSFQVRAEIPGWRVTRRRLRAVEPVRRDGVPPSSTRGGPATPKTGGGSWGTPGPPSWRAGAPTVRARSSWTGTTTSPPPSSPGARSPSSGG